MLYLKRRRIGCMFGTFVALQKILTRKAKRKKNLIVFMVEKQNVLYVIKIYHITQKNKQMNNQRHYF